MTNSPVRTWFLTIVAVVSAGCGFYSMAGSIPPHIKSIAIPLLVNQTAEFGMAESITDQLQEIFIEENILRVVGEDNADSILRGTIVKVEDAPYTYTREEAVSEYRFTVVLEVEWVDVKKDEVLLKKRFSGWGAYGLSGDTGSDGIDNDGDGLIDEADDDEFGEPRSFAAKVAVTKIAEDILNEIMTSW
jgi:outer membrane lipopolysaccharide assembly protein LptE/RlpB